MIKKKEYFETFLGTQIILCFPHRKISSQQGASPGTFLKLCELAGKWQVTCQVDKCKAAHIGGDNSGDVFKTLKIMNSELPAATEERDQKLL